MHQKGSECENVFKNIGKFDLNGNSRAKLVKIVSEINVGAVCMNIGDFFDWLSHQTENLIVIPEGESNQLKKDKEENVK